MRLFFVRHGQTASNIGRHLDTAEPGPDLTDLGRRQASGLPDALGVEAIELIYASTLVRTQQTAVPLARSLGQDIHVRAGVREIPAGSLEMANDEDSIQTYLSIAFGWAAGALTTPIPGTDVNGVTVLGGFDVVVEEIADAGVDVAAIFTHGAVIRAWTAARCHNITVDFVSQNAVANTGAVLVSGDPGRWRVERWQEQALVGDAASGKAIDGAAAEPLH